MAQKHWFGTWRLHKNQAQNKNEKSLNIIERSTSTTQSVSRSIVIVVVIIIIIVILLITHRRRARFKGLNPWSLNLFHWSSLLYRVICSYVRET